MKLPLHIAQHLADMLHGQTAMASSQLKHACIDKMLQDGILGKKQLSNTRSSIYIAQHELMAPYLANQFGIHNLNEYISALKAHEINRADSVLLASDSKLTKVRTFKGFLVNCYQPILATLNNQTFKLSPQNGSFTFIRDYENFSVEDDITVVGIENAENFYHIQQQAYLFTHIKPLFVSRYPQSNDLVKWLQGISNPYLHFGDLDLAGIQIYQHEFQKHLGQKSRFFLPPNTASLLEQYGNRDLFNKQFNKYQQSSIEHDEEAIQALYKLIMSTKKVLEQEIFISGKI